MSSSRPRRNAASKAMDAIADDVPRMSRPRRSASGTDAALATVSRDPPSSPSSQQSLRLTVKLSSSKLRQATGGPNPRGGHSSSARDPFAGGEIIQGKRARNVKKTYVVESESDEEDEDEEMEDIADDDDIEGDSADDDDEDEDEDAEGEEDADGDIDMDIPPPPPIIKVSRAANAKAVISAKPAAKSDGKIIEQKEVSDDELSELDSDIEESMQIGGDEDAEGEDEEIEVEEDDEDDLDSDDETPADGSRASTPDLTKLTKRQRARLEEGGSGHLLALPDEVQVKKHLTAEEHAMRRAEMARRRKNLSEKRNEEEKMETINKLLKKQAPKTNARRKDLNGTDENPDAGMKPNPIFIRWTSNKDGNIISVPGEVTGGPLGPLFGTRMVQEVE